MFGQHPLPDKHEIADLFSNHPQIFHIKSAWEICLDVEHNAKGKNETMFARILGYLIIYAPNHQAQNVVINEIVSCNADSEKLLELGEFYFNHFIRPFKKIKGRTPAPSGHQSRPSFNTLRDMISTMLVQFPTDHQQAKRSALVRDGFRCMVSGAYDKTSMQQSDDLRAQVKEFDRAGVRIGVVGNTQCAHILSESTNRDISSDDSKRHYAASAWAVLDRFGYGSVLQELNGSGVHRLENILTLLSDVHDRFDRLELWFEETSIKHQYNIGAIDPEEVFVFSRLPRHVKFETEHQNLALPSPTYLKLHAACAKVAHLSGAGEYIEKLERNFEPTDVLESDGGSTRLLHEALLSLKATSIGVRVRDHLTVITGRTKYRLYPPPQPICHSKHFCGLELLTGRSVAQRMISGRGQGAVRKKHPV